MPKIQNLQGGSAPLTPHRGAAPRPRQGPAAPWIPAYYFTLFFTKCHYHVCLEFKKRVLFPLIFFRLFCKSPFSCMPLLPFPSQFYISCLLLLCPSLMDMSSVILFILHILFIGMSLFSLEI